MNVRRGNFKGDTVTPFVVRARWVSSSGSRSSKLLCELPTPPEESSKHVLESTGIQIPVSRLPPVSFYRNSFRVT